jgi:DnaJ-class molecular chaperone
VVTALAAAAGAFLVLKGRRRASVTCRSCGGRVEGPSDLCQKCRHEAADALRHAAAERADQERAHEQEQRGLREHEEEQRQKARQAEDEGHRRQQEEARQREEAARQQREFARQQSQAVAASEDVFDPHAVLGVPRDASLQAIQAAYEAAKAKYDPDQVAFLSTELQAHYKTKAEAVERAYQTLTLKS